MDKLALEHLLSSYNWWIGFSTIAVAVGILGEYVAHFIFEKEARSNKRAMVASVLFGILVLGGVVGEYLFGSKLSQVSETLQRIADKEVADSNVTAEAARAEAAAARKGSSENNERAAKALESAEVARKNAEQYRLQIAQANERAANAENETAKLAKRFANRNLAKAQLNALADTLRSFAGQEFRIVTYWDLNEPATITEQIKSGLETAGWKFVPPQQYEFLVGGVSGVQIYVDPATDRQIKSAASELARVLNGDGIVAVVRNENSISVDRVIHLNVGTKE